MPHTGKKDYESKLAKHVNRTEANKDPSNVGHTPDRAGTVHKEHSGVGSYYGVPDPLGKDLGAPGAGMKAELTDYQKMSKDHNWSNPGSSK